MWQLALNVMHDIRQCNVNFATEKWRRMEDATRTCQMTHRTYQAKDNFITLAFGRGGVNPRKLQAGHGSRNGEMKHDARNVFLAFIHDTLSTPSRFFGRILTAHIVVWFFQVCNVLFQEACIAFRIWMSTFALSHKRSLFMSRGTQLVVLHFFTEYFEMV